MPRLQIFITERISRGLRGELTRWMLELKPGVFIGTLSTLVGEKLWGLVNKKMKAGGAIWIRATNTEQRFEIKSSGDYNRSIRDLEGLQLITTPMKEEIIENTTNSSPSDHITKPRKPRIKNTNQPEIEIPKWDTGNLPDNFITRTAKYTLKLSNLESNYSSNSAYWEYPPEKVWDTEWLKDIEETAKIILKIANDSLNTIQLQNLPKKIVALDIETTNYIPKAYEGYVNIIGVAVLEIIDNPIQPATLELFQSFNMSREKELAPILLTQINPYLQEAELLLVFNQDFDVKIINSIIKTFNLNILLPKTIVDLKQNFQNLKSLEEDLSRRIGFHRTLTIKGSYDEYYNLFKGLGINGIDKQIEPIGNYNLMDCLSPLLKYLINHFDIK